MNQAVVFILSWFFVSVLSVEKPVVSGPTAIVVPNKEHEDPPISIGETDLIIQNRMCLKIFLHFKFLQYYGFI